MRRLAFLRSLVITSLLLVVLPLQATTNEGQVLAKVDGVAITAEQLEGTIASAPFATQFPTLEIKEQAAVRGTMLTRLVDAEILRQEALAMGLQNTPDFASEVANYRSGLLYQKYVEHIRNSIKIPAAKDQRFKELYRGNPDALAAARSAYVSRQFKQQRAENFKELAQRYHLKTWPSRLTWPKDDTLLAQADGFKIYFRDVRIPPGSSLAAQDNKELQQERMDEFLDILLAARAAQDLGIHVEEEVAAFKNILLPRMLMDIKTKEWVSDKSVLREYFNKNKKIGYMPEYRDIGQIVLKSREQAEQVRQRILNGESLFVLAGQLSIDPYGRAKNGSVGWRVEGSGYPQIEKALQGLKDNEISEVIETPAGFNLVMISGRRASQQKTFFEIEERIRQAFLEEQRNNYLQALRKSHKIEWLLPDRKEIVSSEK
ncbi:MAG: peptidylprolyl isomerase [gamma proteobacterium symbiont of Bathyaustriella thionipta]|nr:peptidylprolyl isomerase [gamma proteobacterium symbiont of Bathyaustriella thionipta]